MDKNTGNGKMLHAADDVLENLLNRASMLKALGAILSSLIWHIRENDGDENKLIEFGDDYSCIICDYADYIHKTIEENVERTKHLLDEHCAAFETLKRTNNASK